MKKLVDAAIEADKPSSLSWKIYKSTKRKPTNLLRNGFDRQVLIEIIIMCIWTVKDVRIENYESASNIFLEIEGVY
jgi:hypothetical protein